MLRRLIIASTLTFGFVLTPFMVSAESEPTSISKEEWINQMKPKLPSLLCEDFVESPIGKKSGINYAKCIEQIPDTITKCLSEINDQIPNTMDPKDVQEWGTTLGTCIGNNYPKTL